MQVKQAIHKLWKQKKNHQRNCYNIRICKIYSLVHFEKEKKALVSSATQKDLDVHSNSGGWSQNHIHGKEKPLHHIKPREQHFPGGRYIDTQI